MDGQVGAVPAAGVQRNTIPAADRGLRRRPPRGGAGELPPSAPAWLAGVKLAVLGGFAWIGGAMALCQPLPEHFSAVFMAAALLPVIGFLVSAIRFAARGKTR